MAEQTVAAHAAGGPGSQAAPSYSDFVSDVSWRLMQLAYRARAAWALLDSAETYDETDLDMLGVSSLLQSLATDAHAIAGDVSSSEFAFQRRIAAADLGESAHALT